MADRQTTTPPNLASLWGVSPDKVRHWIDTGELRASNLAKDPNGRPRYAIDNDDAKAFWESRKVKPTTEHGRSVPKRKQNPKGYKEFF